VVFLGDLLDEGSETVEESTYVKYVRRFKAIYEEVFFSGGSVEMAFVSGDNDVGGESDDPVTVEKVSRFKKGSNFCSHHNVLMTFIGAPFPEVLSVLVSVPFWGLHQIGRIRISSGKSSWKGSYHGRGSQGSCSTSGNRCSTLRSRSCHTYFAFPHIGTFPKVAYSLQSL